MNRVVFYFTTRIEFKKVRVSASQSCNMCNMTVSFVDFKNSKSRNGTSRNKLILIIFLYYYFKAFVLSINNKICLSIRYLENKIRKQLLNIFQIYF